MQKILFACVIAVIVISPATFATGDDESISQLQERFDKAKRDLDAARKDFAGRLSQDHNYIEAKKQLYAIDGRVAAAKSGGDADGFLKASKEKRSAQAALRTVASKIEAADPTVAAAMKKVEAADADLQAAAGVELRKKEKAAAEKREGYMAIVNGEHAESRKIESVPLIGNEASLTILKAKPQEYLDKPFTLCGAISLSDYYNYGYDNCKSTHYSFDFHSVNKDAQIGSEYAHLYQKRSMGDDIVKILAKLEEHHPGTMYLMRFKATVSSTYVRTFDEASQMYEVLDWQFLTKDGKWTAWHSEIRD